MQIRLLVMMSVLLVPLLVPASAVAQTGTVSVQPYGFIGPGAFSGGAPSLHVGAGVDVVHASGLGAGAEFFYAGPFPDGFDYGLGLMSFGASYRWGSHRLRPLVTGGYTQTVLRGTGDLFYVGAGMEYWMQPGVGLRVEFRDHTRDRSTHLRAARVGLTWGW